MTQANIDYKNNLFEHPELTRIVGEPSTATLITLQAKIRDNAQSVQSDLGGGEHGHLGQVCTPEAYCSLVPNAAPYERPENPGRLLVAEGLMQYQIAQYRDEHAESIRIFSRGPWCREGYHSANDSSHRTKIPTGIMNPWYK